MAEIKLTIGDQEVMGEEGDTILQVCQKNGCSYTGNNKR